MRWVEVDARAISVGPREGLVATLATFAVIWLDVSPTLAVAIGTAAGMAAVTRMLLTPILFAALLVGPSGLDAVPAAVLAAAAAWLVIATLERRRQAQEEAVAYPMHEPAS